MRYRIKEVVDAGVSWYYPQYKGLVFWKNFEEQYRGIKWIRRWNPFFDTPEGAREFLDGKSNKAVAVQETNTPALNIRSGRSD